MAGPYVTGTARGLNQLTPRASRGDFAFDRQLGRTPSLVASYEIGHVGSTSPLEQADGDAGPITALAMHQEPAVLWEFLETASQLS